MIFDEPLLEPIARYLRFKKGIAKISSERSITLVDLGCGPKIRFYHFLERSGIKVKKYFGIDPLLDIRIVKKHRKEKGIELIKNDLVRRIPLPTDTADYVVGFAFLEHVEYPQAILNEAIRIVKKGGKVIITTPSPRAKFFLEFLTELGLISHREIHEHKFYFDKNSLEKIIAAKNINLNHGYFERGLNNFLVIEKLKST